VRRSRPIHTSVAASPHQLIDTFVDSIRQPRTLLASPTASNHRERSGFAGQASGRINRAAIGIFTIQGLRILRRTKPTRAFVLLTAMGAICGVERACAATPNIVFILADDLGIGDLGYTNQLARAQAGLPSISTPNIDALASQSLSFANMYGS